MMQGNNFYGNYGYGNTMWGYSNQQPAFNNLKVTQTLSAEEINKMRSKEDTTSVSLTQDQILRSKCVHKDLNGKITLYPAPGNEMVRCSICGETFCIQEYPMEQVEAAVDTLTDVLQQTKTFGLTLPKELIVQYMPVIELIRKIPGLYKVALDQYNRYNGGAVMGNNQPFNQINGIDAMEAVMATGSYNNGYTNAVYGPANYGTNFNGGQPNYGMNNMNMNMNNQIPAGYAMDNQGNLIKISNINMGQQQAGTQGMQQANTVAAPGTPNVGNPFGVEGTGVVNAATGAANNATGYTTATPMGAPAGGNPTAVESTFGI